jgi:hypothetical protein
MSVVVTSGNGSDGFSSLTSSANTSCMVSMVSASHMHSSSWRGSSTMRHEAGEPAIAGPSQSTPERHSVERNVWRQLLRHVLGRLGIANARALPRGAIVAVAELTACVPAELVRPTLTTDEAAMGDYDDGRWAWRLEHVRRLTEPIPCSGALSFWQVPVEASNALFA